MNTPIENDGWRKPTEEDKILDKRWLARVFCEKEPFEISWNPIEKC